MNKIKNLLSYHWLLLLLIMAVCAAIGAWFSINLLSIAMANVKFVSEHGWFALKEGGLIQFTSILLKSSAVFLSYLMFKAIETELISRWRKAGYQDFEH